MVEEKYEMSSFLKELTVHVEEMLDTEINILRMPDIPQRGILLDIYSSEKNTKNTIIFSSQQVGLIKDYVIALNSIRLLLKGVAHKNGTYKVLSFDQEMATGGMEQIYLDILKDTTTRALDLEMKKKMMFYIYLLFYETIIDLPFDILANMIIANICPEMRNAQVYYLLKESMRDMHDLVSYKAVIPNRYFVMHNAMFYARDLLLANRMSEYKLNPMINIPELKKFKNLNMMELMTQRWEKSAWYQTKLVGDYLYDNLIKMNIPELFSNSNEADYLRMYGQGTGIINTWIKMLYLQNFYFWDTPEHQEITQKNKDNIETIARNRIFNEE